MVEITSLPAVDLAAVKAWQQAAWSAGDYAVVGTTLQIVGETLCEALDLRAGERVLDVAAGNGNATLAAARRWTDVTSTDYVAALLERGRARASAEGLPVRFEQADAESLPYADASFDVVLSTFGVMFAPNQEQAAAEIARVCKPGGRIGLANWTPSSFIRPRSGARKSACASCLAIGSTRSRSSAGTSCSVIAPPSTGSTFSAPHTVRSKRRSVPWIPRRGNRSRRTLLGWPSGSIALPMVRWWPRASTPRSSSGAAADADQFAGPAA